MCRSLKDAAPLLFHYHRSCLALLPAYDNCTYLLLSHETLSYFKPRSGPPYSRVPLPPRLSVCHCLCRTSLTSRRKTKKRGHGLIRRTRRHLDRARQRLHPICKNYHLRRSARCRAANNTCPCNRAHATIHSIAEDWPLRTTLRPWCIVGKPR